VGLKPDWAGASGSVADSGGLPRHGIGPQGPWPDSHVRPEAVLAAIGPVPLHGRVVPVHGGWSRFTAVRSRPTAGWSRFTVESASVIVRAGVAAWPAVRSVPGTTQ
jgi:hypothetical protein